MIYAEHLICIDPQDIVEFIVEVLHHGSPQQVRPILDEVGAAFEPEKTARRVEDPR